MAKDSEQAPFDGDTIYDNWPAVQVILRIGQAMKWRATSALPSGTAAYPPRTECVQCNRGSLTEQKCCTWTSLSEQARDRIHFQIRLSVCPSDRVPMSRASSLVLRVESL